MIELTPWLASLGFLLSAGLAMLKVWETFIRDRLRLVADASLTILEDEPDEITVMNLSPFPIYVSHYTVAWRSPWPFLSEPAIEQTPFAGPIEFKIDGQGKIRLEFREGDKLRWGQFIGSRKLYLTLHIYGRRWPKVVIAHEGYDTFAERLVKAWHLLRKKRLLAHARPPHAAAGGVG
ncbi:hypothetical protein [Chelatococcus reniformis]|uniref:Uncharacterized protein n=1 Tax=Chelatococcus reniformis TaxID=1494448 RepID=A0A916XD22_9HYPH|nr:hypothetical protein [Chelatococcus reniformis]GGC61670.1 hypothetical protein GCM10010994_20350 [Chelatococcus reniformis]